MFTIVFFFRALTRLNRQFNRVSIFALNRFYSFRLKRFLASIHAVLSIMDLTSIKLFTCSQSLLILTKLISC